MKRFLSDCWLWLVGLGIQIGGLIADNNIIIWSIGVAVWGIGLVYMIKRR